MFAFLSMGDGMSTWLSETEYRQSGAESAGVTINVAFLQEIKTDFGFRILLNEVYHRLKPNSSDQANWDDPFANQQVTSNEAADLLSDLRDELKTYFALEEFYGYFSQSKVSNPSVNKKAVGLQAEHETLFLELNDLVELAEQVLYHEIHDVPIEQIADQFEEFCKRLAAHEQNEMELMMRLCNEEIGVGD